MHKLAHVQVRWLPRGGDPHRCRSTGCHRAVDRLAAQYRRGATGEPTPCLPGDLSAFGVGDTLAEALDDLGEGVRALFNAGPVPEELTREIAVTVGGAA